MPLDTFAPDTADYQKPGFKLIQNMIPLPGGSVGPLKDFVALGSSTLADRCSAIASGQRSASAYYIYAGTKTKLYEGDASYNFTDQSVGGGYSLGDNDSWEIFFFDRNQKVIATWLGQAVQSMTIGQGSSAAFANMISSTEKPKAAHGAVIGQFVVLGNINSTADGRRPTRIHWSGFGDETDFDPDSATQCDYEDLANGGQVQKIVGGNEYGVVFQEEVVRTLRYVGGQTIFDIRPINYAPGTSIPRSVIAHEGVIYYIAQSGFIALDGLNINYIGKGKVDKYFFDTYGATSFAANTLSVARDPLRKIIWWAYPTSGGVAWSDVWLGYKYDEGRWVRLTGPSVNNVGWIRNSTFDPILVGFNISHQLQSLNASSGAAMHNAGVLETGLIAPVPGKRCQLNGVRLIGDNQALALNADVNVSVRSYDRADPATLPAYSTAVPRDLMGLNPVRIAGNLLQIKTSISVSPTGLSARYTALELEYEVLGDR
jgi:hypothetical protein